MIVKSCPEPRTDLVTREILHLHQASTLHHELTQQWDGFHQAADLFHGALRLAAFVTVAAQAVGPAHHPAKVGFGLLVKLLQQLGGHWEVVLTITEPTECFSLPLFAPP